MEFLTDGKRHLVCMPYSVENLHKMADELGIKRSWFHVDHYDIPKRRIKEIEARCVMVSSKDIVKITRRRINISVKTLAPCYGDAEPLE